MLMFKRGTNPDGSRYHQVTFCFPTKDPSHLVQLFAAVDFLTSLV